MSKGDATITGNSIMIRRLFSNLISNAINYSHEGATISTIIQEKDNLALISVIDNGPGISSDHLPYITTRFYRGHQTGSLPKGTGLGLAIVHSIVGLHNGKMSITSETGVGTTVSIWLPKQ